MELNGTLILAALILTLLWLLSGKSRGRRHLPPGPAGLPVIGNLLQLDKRAPFKSLLKLSESYGPVVTLYAGPLRVVALVGYDTIKEALVDHADDFVGRGPIAFIIRLTRGFGLAISNGERWQQLRRFTLKTLRDFGMGRKGMEEWIQEESKHLVARMESTKATPFDPTFFLSSYTSNVICCLVFGQRFSYDDDHFLSLLKTISDILKFGSSPWGQLYNIFPRVVEWLPGPHHSVFARMDKLREFTIKKIEEHKDSLDPSSPRDYIDCFLMRLNQEKDVPTSEFHYENLVSTVVNLYTGGTETTSSTLRFALNVLMKYPETQAAIRFLGSPQQIQYRSALGFGANFMRDAFTDGTLVQYGETWSSTIVSQAKRMQQEIDTVIGHHRCPNMEDRKSLSFTDAVIHETQRFMDIVPLGVPHYALHDITFRGYVIPKGTLILPLLHSVLKEEKRWATPWNFNPQHFLDQNGNFKKNPAFLPFSAGKRSCVGESLARMELFLLLVSLLQHFTFSCPEGPDSIDLSPEYSSFANLPRKYMVIATPRWQ